MKGDLIQLYGTVTQGVADAFATASINTALSASLKSGLLIKNIFIEQVTDVPAAIAANMQYEYAIARTVKAVMPTILDNDLLWKYKVETSIITSGAVLIPSVIQFAPNFDILLIESAITFMIDTTGTGVTNNAVVRIDCEAVTVTDSERIAILQNSIN
jgi:hypothetical protein